MTLPSLGRAPLSGSSAFAAVEIDPASFDVYLLDQRRLPSETHYVRCTKPDEVAAGIRDMIVRGAPAIGIAAAYALRMEDRIGSIEVGKLADVVVLDGDLETTSAEDMPSLDIWLTLLGGAVTYSKRPQ